MPAKESRYVHGTDPDEQDRLARLNDILNAAALREIGLARGERVVDFGCGLGQFTRALARAAGPGSRVVGIERSAEQIRRALQLARDAGEEALVDLRQVDILSAPLRDDEWGAFDLAHARFVLEHIPEPPAAVAAMVRAVRPGGRIILQDDDHDVLRLWPEPPGFEAVWRAYMHTYERNGNDPLVGRKLVALLNGAGATPVRNAWLFFGGCAGSPEFPALVENMARILMGARGEILATGRLDATAFDAGIAAYRLWGALPDAALWFAVAFAEGVRPGAGTGA